jgi:hypothetical protein
MMKESKNIVISALKKFVAEFPRVEFTYEFNEETGTHLVKVVPLVFFESSEELAEFDIDLSAKINGLFPEEIVCLVSENGPIELKNPELVVKRDLQEKPPVFFGALETLNMVHNFTSLSYKEHNNLLLGIPATNPWYLNHIIPKSDWNNLDNLLIMCNVGNVLNSAAPNFDWINLDSNLIFSSTSATVTILNDPTSIGESEEQEIKLANAA